LVETTAADMAKIEELLEIAPGFFSSPYIVKTKEEHSQDARTSSVYVLRMQHSVTEINNEIIGVKACFSCLIFT
jgi:hypothetical protein